MRLKTSRDRSHFQPFSRMGGMVSSTESPVSSTSSQDPSGPGKHPRTASYPSASLPRRDSPVDGISIL